MGYKNSLNLKESTVKDDNNLGHVMVQAEIASTEGALLAEECDAGAARVETAHSVQTLELLHQLGLIVHVLWRVQPIRK